VDLLKSATNTYDLGRVPPEGLAAGYLRSEPLLERAICELPSVNAFRRMVLLLVNGLVEELELYADSNCTTASELVRVWEKLQPYRIAVHRKCSSLAARFFASISGPLWHLAVLGSCGLIGRHYPHCQARDTPHDFSFAFVFELGESHNPE